MTRKNCRKKSGDGAAALTAVKHGLGAWKDLCPSPVTEVRPREKPAARIRSLTLDTRAPWSQIPEPADWAASHGALPALGQVSDTFRVTVNGTGLAPVDRLHPVVDVGAPLRSNVSILSSSAGSMGHPLDSRGGWMP